MDSKPDYHAKYTAAIMVLNAIESGINTVEQINEVFGTPATIENYQTLVDQIKHALASFKKTNASLDEIEARKQAMLKVIEGEK